MLFLALFARDGRYQLVTSAAFLVLLLVVATRLRALVRLRASAVMALLAWATASATWSMFLSDSIRQVANLWMWTIVGLALASVGSVEAIGKIWLRVGRVALLMAVLGAIEVARLDADAGSLFTSKNHVGYAAASSLVPIIATEWRSHRWRVVVAWSLAIFASITANSQTGVTLAIVIPLVFLVSAWFARARGSGWTAIGTAVAGCLGIVVVGAFQTIVNRTTGALGRDSELSGRSDIWAAVFDTIRDQPVIGTGLGGIWLRTEEQPTRGLLAQVVPELRRAELFAHNGFLDAWLQLGLVGAVLLVVVAVRGIWLGARRATADRDLRSAIPLVAAVMYVCANLTETRLFNDQAWVLLVMAATMSLARRPVKHTETRSRSLRMEPRTERPRVHQVAP